MKEIICEQTGSKAVAVKTICSPLTTLTIVRITTFLEKCQAIIEKVEDDKSLSKKLLQSDRYLDQIKDMKARIGSIEHCMDTVKYIDETGEFTILSSGLIKMKYDITSTTNAERQDATRHMTYDDIAELRAKLMLLTARSDCKAYIDR